MQGMAGVHGGAAVPRENQELFGCPGVGAHQNGSIGPEGTSLSAGTRVGEGRVSLCSGAQTELRLAVSKTGVLVITT